MVRIVRDPYIGNDLREKYVEGGWEELDSDFVDDIGFRVKNRKDFRDKQKYKKNGQSGGNGNDKNYKGMRK
jgi:hypothetical protein